MRQQFIALADAPTYADAETLAPWAAHIVPADGGWVAFESATDYRTWITQI